MHGGMERVTDTGARVGTVDSWDRVSLLPEMAGLARRTLAATRSMLMHCTCDEGAAVPRHEHPQEQFTIMLEGRLRFVTGAEGAENEFEAGEGDVVTIPPDVPHRADALAPSTWIDVFTPIREELLPAR
jgi:quercetin dioxygenase-like cupin family protein